MKIQVNVECCVCKSMHSHELFVTKFQQAIYPGQFHIRKCDHCGLLFNSPRLPDNDFPVLYQKDYYVFKENHKNTFGRMIDMYRRTVALVHEDIEDKEVLEIGSARGHLLAIMNKLGWKVQGLDLSVNAADFAIKKLKIPTYKGTLEDYVQTIRSSQKTFPLVLAIDVIEHVLHPKEFAENLGEIVAPGGILIIDTPNGNAADIDSQGIKWLGFNPFHIFFFSINNLTSLLGKHGFVLEKAFSYNNDIMPDNHNIYIKAEYAVKQMLKKVGFFNICATVYHFYKNLIGGLLSKQLNTACKKIKDGKTYFQTPDSNRLYAEQCRGGNLVIIFRKSS